MFARTCWLRSIPTAGDSTGGQGSSHPDGGCEVSPLDFWNVQMKDFFSIYTLIHNRERVRML